jgi:hypothetical protein
MSGKNKKNKNEYQSSLQEALEYLKDKPGSDNPKVLEEYIRNRKGS